MKLWERVVPFIALAIMVVILTALVRLLETMNEGF